MTVDELSSYDSFMKLVQLNSLLLKGTAMLVDESQDLNACQIHWIKQHVGHMDLYLVGDPVQTIYTFRYDCKITHT